MAIAPQNLSLSPYFTENLGKNYFTYNCKSIAYSVLEKITWVAILAIIGVVFTISLAGTVLTGGASLIAFGAIVSSYPLVALSTYARIQSNHYEELASFEQKVIARLEEIKEWSRPQIEQFLQEEDLQVANIPLEELQRLSPEEPLKALLPLIARFQILQATAAKLAQVYRQALYERHENREICLQTRQAAWNCLEKDMLPTAISGAILLQIIQDPSSQLQINYPNGELIFPGVGKVITKSFEERTFDQIIDKNDDYLLFPIERDREPLSLEDLNDNPAPKVIRSKIFV